VKQDRALKIVAFLIISAIVLSVFINLADSNSLLTTSDSIVRVTPANLLWEKTYGGTGDDRAFYALPTGNGDFLVVGSSESIIQGTGAGWALMLNPDGNAVWNHTYLEGFDTELRFALQLTDGFLLVGNQFTAPGDVNGYVARINTQGALIWSTVVGGEKIDKLFSATFAQDGFVLFGLTYSYGSVDSDAWAVKLDVNGAVMWNNTYGGLTDDAFRTCVAGQDGGYLAAGYTNSSSTGYDFLLVKFDANGNTVWNRTYGGSQSEKAYSMTWAEGGYVIVGDIESAKTASDAWVVKVDLNGNMIWDKTVGGPDADSPSCVTTSKDGSYLVAGFTFSYGRGQRDFWLLKVSDSGQLLWSCTQGNEAFQEAYGVIEKSQNEFVMVGWSDPFNMPKLIGKATYDFYIVDMGANQKGGGLTSLQFIQYGSVFVILAISWILIINVYVTKKRNKTK
jgi:hypothetical protein